MEEKKTLLIATVKEREETFKIALKSLYEQFDHIHVVLNYYEEVPEWLKGLKGKVTPHLNPTNKNAHDSIWQYIPKNGFVFIADDDISYPQNYVDKLIETLEAYKRKVVVTAHGSKFIAPVKDYHSRAIYGYSADLANDVKVDMAGVGVTAFHSSLIQPQLQEFQLPFCRDLYFAILCAKKDIPIICLKRHAGWLVPLKTYGQTVWEVTNTNDKLRQCKNRLLKENLLPALFCDKTNSKYCLITDYDFNTKLLNNTVTTLEGVVNCNIVIFNDTNKDYNRSIPISNKADNRLTQHVTPEELVLGRMGSKMLTQYRFINSLRSGSRVISADADLHFLSDPYKAFPIQSFKKTWDIGVTTRSYPYHYPINGGVVMFNVSNKLKQFLNFAISQIYSPTWQPLVKWLHDCKHEGTDWYIDQDFWCAAFLNKEEVLKKFDIVIDDIGPYYNYCPHADGLQTVNGKEDLMLAYRTKSVAVLHLKSRLKELLFDGSIR